MPGGTHANRRFLADSVAYAEGVDEAGQLLLCDAQTSGGLLIAVAAPWSGAAEALVEALERMPGTPCAAVVGRLEEGPKRGPRAQQA